jgi:hypothetical protein
MRRWQGVKRGQAIWLLLAAAVGYLIGNWNAAAPHIAGRREPTSAVALRFQEDFDTGAAAQPAVPSIAPQPVLGTAQFALFEPHPIMPSAGFAQVASQPPTVQAAALPASTEMAELTPAGAAAQPEALPVQEADTPIEAVKRHLAPSHPARRADTLFDDAQLARIKHRLHLTADQEPMWPAVAVALRNIGREQKRQARRRGEGGGIDPNSEAVQDLKSAAIPLLMSFSDAQKDEVRHLARNMGLQQLASEF